MKSKSALSAVRMICEHCGTEIDSFQHYCPDCGYDLWNGGDE